MNEPNRCPECGAKPVRGLRCWMCGTPLDRVSKLSTSSNEPPPLGIPIWRMVVALLVIVLTGLLIYDLVWQGDKGALTLFAITLIPGAAFTLIKWLTRFLTGAQYSIAEIFVTFCLSTLVVYGILFLLAVALAFAVLQACSHMRI